MPRSGVKTMTQMKVPLQVKNRNITIDSGLMYMCIMAMDAKKKVPVQRVMSFENAAVPLSMFSDDGSMLLPKAKSDFMHKLESLIDNKVTSLKIGRASCRERV